MDWIASSASPPRNDVHLEHREIFQDRDDADDDDNSADDLLGAAVDALRDILEAHGELLPLQDEGGVELFAHNTWALDAFDHERTDGSRDENGRISNANKHVFIPSVVEGVDMFKQAKERAGQIYVSERFLSRWKQAKLKGLDFNLVWDSDLPPEAQPNTWTSKPVKLSTIK